MCTLANRIDKCLETELDKNELKSLENNTGVFSFMDLYSRRQKIISYLNIKQLYNKFK